MNTIHSCGGGNRRGGQSGGQWSTQGDAACSTYDSTLTKVIQGTMVKLCAWYDNEWGFSNRMLDTALARAKAG